MTRHHDDTLARIDECASRKMRSEFNGLVDADDREVT